MESIEEYKNYLSLHARNKLTEIGYKEKDTMRICMACKKHSSELGHHVQHPYQKKVKEIEKRLRKQPTNQALVGALAKYKSFVHHTTRCCGARYENVEVDVHLAYWKQWLDREIFVPQIQIEHIRVNCYGDSHVHRDDDFIRMFAFWGIDDYKTGQLISIFREEESRRLVMGKIA